jgi:hypothetical protein
MTAAIQKSGRRQISKNSTLLPKLRLKISAGDCSVRGAKISEAPERIFTLTLAVLLVFSLGTVASADEKDSAKICIVAASTHLPASPDLKVKSSRSEPVPATLGGPLKSAAFSALIHIDVTAAKQDLTYNFVCAITSDGRTIVNPYR